MAVHNRMRSPSTAPTPGAPIHQFMPAELPGVTLPITASVKIADAVETSGMSDRLIRLCQQAVATGAVEWRLATPEWARDVLARYNNRNRPMGKSWMKLQAVIARDHWCFNGDTICFDWNSQLMNGQNRLQAIAASGQVVPVMVVYNLDPDAFDSYDGHKRRSPSDVLAILGHKCTHLLAATLAWQKAFDDGRIDKTDGRALPLDQVKELVAHHPNLYKSVKFANKYGNNRIMPPAILGFCHYHFVKRDPVLTEKLFERVIGGIDLQRGTHEFALFRRLKGDMAGRRSAADQIELLAITILTWNRLRAKSPAKEILVWRDGAQFPSIE